MRDDDVLHASALLSSKGNGNATGIQRYTVVDEIAGEALIQSRVAIAIEVLGRSWISGFSLAKKTLRASVV